MWRGVCPDNGRSVNQGRIRNQAKTRLRLLAGVSGSKSPQMMMAKKTGRKQNNVGIYIIRSNWNNNYVSSHTADLEDAR